MDFTIKEGVLEKYKGRDKTVVIPDGVTTIGNDAFFGRKSLKEIIIPGSVTEIGGCAFYDCSSLEKAVIPDSVTKIGRFAFSWCKSLKSVYIPGSITEIGGCAFSSCKSLEKVVISEGVKTIGEQAFFWCESLKDVIIPDSVTKIGDRAFNGCKSLKDEKGFVVVNGILFDYFGKYKNVVIPDGVTAIGEDAFYGCESLESVSIPGVNILKKKYKELVLEEISDELNKYVNTMTKALLYFDSINEIKDLNYKTDLCKYPNIIIRGHEDIKLTDEERKIISSQLKEKCKEKLFPFRGISIIPFCYAYFLIFDS